MNALNMFWTTIDKGLDLIVTDRADTFEKVKAILDAHGNPDGTAHSGQSFFGGSGGDRSLAAALSEVGWRFDRWSAPYDYQMSHPVTGAKLLYLEGDVWGEGL